MDYEFLHSCFPNYTLAMWQGNEPKNHTSSINGDYFDNYEDMEGNGSCQAYHDVAVSGEWSFGHYRIFISDSRQFDGKYMLHIMHNTGDDSVYWVYRNDNGICRLAYISYATKKPYISEAKLRKILNPKNQPGSECCKMFNEKAGELFELGDWRGEYRDL